MKELENLSSLNDAIYVVRVPISESEAFRLVFSEIKLEVESNLGRIVCKNVQMRQMFCQLHHMKK